MTTSGPFSLYENEDQKPPKRSTVLSYLLIVIVSGLLLSSDISEKLDYDDGLSMTYYEFAIIVVFLQALIGAVRFSKCKLRSHLPMDFPIWMAIFFHQSLTSMRSYKNGLCR